MPQALKLTLKGQTLSRNLGNIADFAFDPSVKSGLQGWFNIGLDAERSRRNWAGGTAASVVGAPDYNTAGYARLKSRASFLQTAIAESNDITFIAVCRSLDTFANNASLPAFIGNFQGPSVSDPGITSQGCLMWIVGAAGQPRLQGYRRSLDGATTNAGHSNNLAVDMTQWRCLIGRIQGNDAMIKDMTSGADSQTTTVMPRFRCANPMRIGSAYATVDGHCDMAHAVIFNRAITDTEMALIHEQLAEYQQTRFGRAI